MTSVAAPRIILFDWHGTLVDTNAAMYGAMDEMLGQLQQLGLDKRLIDPSKSKTEDDGRLVEYVTANHRLHPKVVADRKASRTDLLEVLFGSDEDAKRIANRAYNACYRNHYGEVEAFERGIPARLSRLRMLGIRLGILTNRAREFLDEELARIEGGVWPRLFDSSVSGGDTRFLKPSPVPIHRALQDFGAVPGAHVWYVGDSTSDTVSAKTAGITSVFFNGAGGDRGWIETIFPGTAEFPHRPDYIVNDFKGLLELVESLHGQDRENRACRIGFDTT